MPIDPQLKSLASFARQLNPHAVGVAEEVSDIEQLGENIANLATRVEDPNLAGRLHRLASRAAGIREHILYIGREGAAVAEALESYEPAPAPVHPRDVPVVATPPPIDPTGGHVAPAHWPSGDDQALAELEAESSVQDDELATAITNVGRGKPQEPQP